jgi:hypothetical protein
MGRKLMIEICRRHEHAFLKALGHAGSLKDKQVHRLRLDVKNIRVLLQLHEAISEKKKPAKKLRELVTPVFSVAGDMRTAALNLNMTHTYRVPVVVKFRHRMKEQKQEAARKLVREIKTFDREKFSRLSRKVIHEFAERKGKELKKETAEHLRAQFAKVRASLFGMSDDEALHEIRKQLKAIKSLGALLNEIDPDHEFSEELKKVNAVYEKIGRWHDTVMLLEELEKFLRELNDPVSALKCAPMVQELRKKSLRSRRLERKLKVDLVM